MDTPTITFDRTRHWAAGRATPAHMDVLPIRLPIRLDTDLDIRLAGNFVWQHPTVASLATALAIHMSLAPQDEPPLSVTGS
ncbi:hypothetical protein ACH4CE_33405 [Streptomyces gelaticus]|uniref:hypothetical protein n=1 Tax=Streptomyces gelaticus TaxID=285446 RepID=UPI00378DF8AB